MRNRPVAAVILCVLSILGGAVAAERPAGTVYVVLAVDTETRNLRSSVRAQRLNLNDYYGDGQVSRAMADSFRLQFTDSFGGHPKFSWFCLTHEAYAESDQRDVTAVWEATRRLLGPILAHGDVRGWHYHADDWIWTDSAAGEGNWAQLTTFDGTRYSHGSDLALAEQMMATLIGKLGVYPVLYRSGWDWENTAFSDWLDDVAPFDFSNAAPMSSDTGHLSSDPAGNRYDWSHAPADWSYYHPDRVDYQRPGTMKRYVFRCLPGHRVVDLDFGSALRRAAAGENVMVAAYAHSYDDLEKFCRVVQGGINSLAVTFPKVRYRYVTALEGAQAMIGTADNEPPHLELSRDDATITVTSDEPLFSFPYGAYQDPDGAYHRARPTQAAPDTTFGQYEWVFDMHGLPFQSFSVGACDRSGNSTVAHLGSGMVRKVRKTDIRSRLQPSIPGALYYRRVID